MTGIRWAAAALLLAAAGAGAQTKQPVRPGRFTGQEVARLAPKFLAAKACEFRIAGDSLKDYVLVINQERHQAMAKINGLLLLMQQDTTALFDLPAGSFVLRYVSGPFSTDLFGSEDGDLTVTVAEKRRGRSAAIKVAGTCSE